MVPGGPAYTGPGGGGYAWPEVPATLAPEVLPMMVRAAMLVFCR